MTSLTSSISLALLSRVRPSIATFSTGLPDQDTVGHEASSRHQLDRHERIVCNGSMTSASIGL